MGKPEFDVVSFFSDAEMQRKDFCEKKAAIDELRSIISGEISSIEIGKNFLLLKLIDGRLFYWRMNSERDNNFTVLTHTGYYEKKISELIPRYVSMDSVIIDIGANKGWFTVLFGKLAETGRVFAFEPEQRAFDELVRNIKLNDLKNIIPLNVALSDHNGVGNMVVPFNHSPLAYLDSKSENDGGNTRVVALDDFIESNHLSLIDLMKIDAEGSEYNILLGAKRLLASEHAPILIVEAFDKCLSRYGSSVNQMIDYLMSLNYRIVDIESGEEYNKKNRKTEYDTDLLCVKQINRLCKTTVNDSD